MFPNFVIILFILFSVLVIIYLLKFIKKKEDFYGYDINNYESVGVVPSKILYLNPQNNLQYDSDYQEYLNNISGYNSGTREYNNPVYARKIAEDLQS